MMKINTYNPEETIAFAEKLVGHLKPGNILCLDGNLGAGKTTFTKGLAKGLKISPKKVSSPTFVLMNIYEGRTNIYHFDLYRMEEIDKMTVMEWDEYFYGEGISVIEWSQRLGPFMPKDYLSIELKHKNENERELIVRAYGKKHQKIMEGLK